MSPERYCRFVWKPGSTPESCCSAKRRAVWKVSFQRDMLMKFSKRGESICRDLSSRWRSGERCPCHRAFSMTDEWNNGVSMTETDPPFTLCDVNALSVIRCWRTIEGVEWEPSSVKSSCGATTLLPVFQIVYRTTWRDERKGLKKEFLTTSAFLLISQTLWNLLRVSSESYVLELGALYDPLHTVLYIILFIVRWSEEHWTPWCGRWPVRSLVG